MPPPPLPRPADAKLALDLIDHGLKLRALRVCLFMAAAPGEWTLDGLHVALGIHKPDLGRALADLAAWELVTCRQHKPAGKGHAINLYKLAA